MTNFCSVAKLISMTLHDLQHFSLAWQRRGAKNHNTGRKKERDPLLSAPKSACLCPFLPPFPTIPVSSRYFFKARKQSIHKILRLWKATVWKTPIPCQLPIPTSQPGCHIFSIQHCTHRVSRIDHSNGLGGGCSC